MKRMWTRSAQDPALLRARDELVYKTSDDMLLARQLAESEEAQGRFGMSALYEIMKTQDELAKSPLLRIGNRTMGAHDAWMQSVNAQLMSRMRAYDQSYSWWLYSFQQAKADEVAQRLYKDMFDENGVIKDPQVIKETQRQTFSQDNPVSEAFSELMQGYPCLETFLYVHQVSY